MLLHQLPTKPDYLRVRVRRRLAQVGAILLKNAAYVLPNTEGAREDFEWVRREVEESGGSAMVMVSQFIAGVTDAELVEGFRALRADDYRALAEAARDAQAAEPAAGLLLKLRNRLNEIGERDYFGGAARAAAEAAIEELGQQLAVQPAAPALRPDGATWVTRHGVFVDRIASAWLIRRFIDPKARFKFVAAQGYKPAAGELGFDLFDGIGYSHANGGCTFETLVHEFGLAEDRGVAAIAQIVHDLDLRDEKFNRGEAQGVLALLQGIVTRYAADAERIEHGRRLFDQLYSHFSRVNI